MEKLLTRRWFLGGFAATVAAPAVILRPQLLMPLRGIAMPIDPIRQGWIMMPNVGGGPVGEHVIEGLSVLYPQVLGGVGSFDGACMIRAGAARFRVALNDGTTAHNPQ